MKFLFVGLLFVVVNAFALPCPYATPLSNPENYCSSFRLACYLNKPHRWVGELRIPQYRIRDEFDNPAKPKYFCVPLICFSRSPATLLDMECNQKFLQCKIAHGHCSAST